MGKPETKTICILLCLLMIFHLGWAKFLLTGLAVYGADYTMRLVVIVVGVKYFLQASDLRKVFSKKDVFWGGIAFTACLVIYRLIEGRPWEVTLNEYFFDPVHFPDLEQPYFIWFDLTVGLALVAVSEELVYRKAVFQISMERSWSSLKLYIISSLSFGLLHLPQGLTSVLTSTMFGIVFMFFYKRNQSLIFLVLAHYLVNLWFFGVHYYQKGLLLS